MEIEEWLTKVYEASNCIVHTRDNVKKFMKKWFDCCPLSNIDLAGYIMGALINNSVLFEDIYILSIINKRKELREKCD